MGPSITCICGYSGPAVADKNLFVCPICRTPSTAAPPAVPPAARAAATPAGAAHPEAAGRLAETVGPGPTASTVYRIPCPRGHVLKAGDTMIGQQVVCPKCNEVFVLRIRESLEYKKDMERRRHEKEARDAVRWLRRAIIATVFVIASFAAMLAIKLLK